MSKRFLIQRLEQNTAQNARPEKMLTNIISLVRYALGKTDTLEPYSTLVDKRFASWLAQQEQGRRFTAEQVE